MTQRKRESERERVTCRKPLVVVQSSAHRGRQPAKTSPPIMPSVPRRMISILALSITCTRILTTIVSRCIQMALLHPSSGRISESCVPMSSPSGNVYQRIYQDTRIPVTTVYAISNVATRNKRSHVPLCYSYHCLDYAVPQSLNPNPPSSAPPKRRPWVQQSAVVRRMSATSNVLACLLWPPFGPQDGANAT